MLYDNNAVFFESEEAKLIQDFQLLDFEWEKFGDSSLFVKLFLNLIFQDK
jgi:hypothetical protein